MNKTRWIPFLKVRSTQQRRQVSWHEHLSQFSCSRWMARRPPDGKAQMGLTALKATEAAGPTGECVQRGWAPGLVQEAGALRERVNVWARLLRPLTAKGFPE